MHVCLYALLLISVLVCVLWMADRLFACSAFQCIYLNTLFYEYYRELISLLTNKAVWNYFNLPPSQELQEQRKDFGAKVFFYRAQLISGAIKLNTKLYKDYAWIARFFISNPLRALLTYSHLIPSHPISFPFSRDELGEYFDAETAEYLFYALPH